MTVEDAEQMARELAEISQATRRLLRMHGELDISYPASDAFKRLASPVASTRLTPQPGRPTAPAPKQEAAPQVRPASFSAEEMAAVNHTISHCERCLPLSGKPAPLVGTGKEDRPSLLIIGEVASEDVFPPAAHELLIKMLAAINLKETDVFQANIVRCEIDSQQVPLANQVQNCRPHLLAQIKQMRPRIICTMGQMASQALLGTKNKLIALRGRFHQLDAIPLMPTYHPSQLIQLPDLKKAAWYDLQLMQHKLRQLQGG